MPFDTLGQCNKGIEAFGLDDSTWSPDTSLLHRSSKPEHIIFSPSLFSNNTNEILSLDSQRWMTDDQGDDDLSQQSSCGSPLTDSIPPLETLHAALSRFRLSFTETGINMEANISTASDLRSLLDAFSKLSCTPAFHQHPHDPPRRNSVVLYRNKSCKSAPVNHIQKVGLLGRMIEPHPRHDGLLTSRQIADKCVDTYFTCWVRHPPVLRRHDFMAWYVSQPAPQETLIVNALCALVFRHTVTHHCTPGLQPFLLDPDRLHQQEEFFFGQARDALAQALDDDPPDRFTVIALTFLCVRTEPSRRHHYGGLAVSLLQQLAIYPRMITTQQDDDDYGLELDTRLWWFVWQIDFFHWTAGYPKITPLLEHPNQRYEQVDLPRLYYDLDTEETHMSIIAQAHTLSLWRLQADIISTMYEQESELTSEQLVAFDDRLTTLDQQWKAPDGPDLDIARTRIGLEHNATLIILHQLFTPEPGTPPSPSSLASLQICIDAALEQLDLLAGCINSTTQCAFDLFELRRVGQVLAMATNDDSRQRDALDRHLERTIHVLAATPEGKMGIHCWNEVAKFLHDQQRQPPAKKKVGPKKQQKKGSEMTVQQRLGQKPLTGLSSSPALSIISFSHQQTPPPPPRTTQTFVQATCNTFDGGTNQPRFRYFNPRKMNKFLFIDESR